VNALPAAPTAAGKAGPRCQHTHRPLILPAYRPHIGPDCQAISLVRLLRSTLTPARPRTEFYEPDTSRSARSWPWCRYGQLLIRQRPADRRLVFGLRAIFAVSCITCPSVSRHRYGPSSGHVTYTAGKTRPENDPSGSTCRMWPTARSGLPLRRWPSASRGARQPVRGR